MSNAQNIFNDMMGAAMGGYISLDAHEAALAVARAEGMREGMERALDRVHAIKATTTSFGVDDVYGNGAVWAVVSCERAIRAAIPEAAP